MEGGYDDEFNVNPSDVISNAGGQPQPSWSQADTASLQQRLVSVAPLFQNQSERGQAQPYGRSSGGGESQKPNAFLNDAAFYANDVGDLGAAQTLLSAKDGRGVFQMYEGHEFNMGTPSKHNPEGQGKVNMKIVPRGSRKIVGPSGKAIDIPMHELARRRGVTVVPFKGSEANADAFRTMLADAKGVFNTMDQLEQLYINNTFLTPYGPSADSSKAKGLESQLTIDMMKVLAGTKGVGGNTSEKDMAFVQAMGPQRASSAFGHLKGNELALLRQARGKILEKVQNAASVNGLDFIAESPAAQKTINKQRYLNHSKSI